MSNKLFKNVNSAQNDPVIPGELLDYQMIIDKMDEAFAYCEMIYDEARKPIDFRFIQVNSAFAIHTDIPIEGLAGRTVNEVIPRLETSWITEYGNVVRTGKSAHFESTSASLGRTFSAYAWPIEADRFAVIFSDISDQKKLDDEAKRAQLVIESVEDPIFSKDMNGIIRTWNKSAERMYGYKKQEIIGKSIMLMVPEDNKHEIKTILDRIRKGKKFEGYETSRITKGGKIIDISINVLPIIENGEIVGATVIHRNVTETKKANKKLEIANAELEESKLALMNLMKDLEVAKGTIEIEKAKDEAMLNSIGDGLLAIDNDEKIIVMNKAAETMLGWKFKDSIGHIITSLPLEDEQGLPLSLDKQLVPTNLSTNTQTIPMYYFVRNDKSRIPIAINVTPIILGEKRIGVIEIFRDITKEKEVDKAKSEFISIASHQLRTPLGIVKWYLEVLSTDEYMQKMPKQTKVYFEELRKNNERILNLVRSLLSIAHIDQGMVNDKPEPTNIAELAKDTLEDLSIMALKKKIELKLQINDAKLPSVLIDPLRLREVIENLVANAIEYNTPLGSVAVVVDRNDAGGFLISVVDTGSGISEDDQRQLFTKFYRTKKAAASNTGGSGLGLYLVKSYVEGWGGHISIESKEDVGSSFNITLPFDTSVKQKVEA